ncbi:MAG: winged helix-turn-helix domain-containing protein [Nitrospiria bacterium]
MAVELWFGREFDTPHERRAFDRFLSDMNDRPGPRSEKYLILVNYFVDGHQIDLTVLKRNAIIIVEFKECAEPFRATQNGDWPTIPGGRIVGIPGQNPYEQVKKYRFRWVNLLTKNRDKFLPPGKAESMDFYHISAVVAICPSLHPETENQIPFARWFRLMGLDELCNYVYEETSPSLNFSGQELRTLAEDILRLRPANTPSEPVKTGSQSVGAEESPYAHFKESGRDLPYPPNHHAQDVQAIKRVISTNNSLLVLGLSGSGKSSVLRFLVSNPAVQEEGMVFVYIDCNLLDRDQSREIVQEEICREILEHLYLQNIGGTKPPPTTDQARQALQNLMKDISREGANHLAVIFDRSEVLQRELGKSFLNYLRGLRDINPKVSYIFGGRNLDTKAFGELADILWTEPHWIGALSQADGQMTIRRHLQRLDINLVGEEIDKMLDCVGRHPQLLKYACELVRAGGLDLNEEVGEILPQLLETPSIMHQCQDLWRDLSFAAQDTLRQLVQGESLKPAPIVDWLTRCGILEYAAPDRVVFTSPLFERYVADLGPPPLALKEGIVFKGSRELILSKEEFALFKVLWDSRPQIVSSEQISEAVWPDAGGETTPQMITNLVKRLRKKLGDKHYIENLHSRGYRFTQGTAPLPRNSDVRTSRPPR